MTTIHTYLKYMSLWFWPQFAWYMKYFNDLSITVWKLNFVFVDSVGEISLFPLKWRSKFFSDNFNKPHAYYLQCSGYMYTCICIRIHRWWKWNFFLVCFCWKSRNWSCAVATTFGVSRRFCISKSGGDFQHHHLSLRCSSFASSHQIIHKQPTFVFFSIKNVDMYVCR